MMANIISQDVIDKLVEDAKRLDAVNKFKTEDEMTNVLRKKLVYYESQVTKGNPLQEAIIMKYLFRHIKGMKTFYGLYD